MSPGVVIALIGAGGVVLAGGFGYLGARQGAASAERASIEAHEAAQQARLWDKRALAYEAFAAWLRQRGERRDQRWVAAMSHQPTHGAPAPFDRKDELLLWASPQVRTLLMFAESADDRVEGILRKTDANVGRYKDALAGDREAQDDWVRTERGLQAAIEQARNANTKLLVQMRDELAGLTPGDSTGLPTDW